MERNFGAEIASTFGARLRHLYEQEAHALPAQMIKCLEQLARAERSRATEPAMVAEDDCRGRR